MIDSGDPAARVRQAGGSVTSGGLLPTGLFGSSAAKFMRLFEGHIRYGSLTATFPDGTRQTVSGPDAGPDATININRWRTIRRILYGGALGFSQAYVEGDWDSPDVAAVIEFGSRNRETLDPEMQGSSLVSAWNRLRHKLKANTRRGARENIHYHYDLGNDFYAAWLDSTMTYSCAVFEKGDNSLESAQRRKYRLLLDKIGAKPGDHILEIGSGWGGFAETAARERDVKVTGVTLSREQLDYSRERIQAAHLGDKVDFKFTDYRDIRGRFDHVVSIEMFEAVGESYWPAYFRKIRQVLKPGGRAGLQIIVIDDAMFESYRRGADFIQTYIFPGGMLGAVEPLRKVVSAAGLDWRGFKRYGQHYADTLAQWRERFEAAFREGRLPDGFDDLFRRIWTYYFSYCEGGFRGGSIDVIQLILERPAAEKASA